VCHSADSRKAGSRSVDSLKHILLLPFSIHLSLPSFSFQDGYQIKFYRHILCELLLEFPLLLDDYMYMAQHSLNLECLIDEWLIDAVCLALDVLMINWLLDFAHCLIFETIS
jgi:hypothetical protein